MRALLLTIVICGLAILIGFTQPAWADDSRSAGSTGVRGAEVIGPVTPILTPAVRDLPQARAWRPGDPIRVVPRQRFEPRAPERRRHLEGDKDPLIELQRNRSPELAPTIVIDQDYDGIAFTGATPPDTVGDVGPNHYVQAVNASTVRIWDKAGTQLANFEMASLAPVGDSCNTNPWGDPIILYDQLADRWFLQEFDANTTNLCIYISTSPDPTGTYNFYKFSPRLDHDYPHFGVWHDAYYGTINRGSEVNAMAFDRTSMLAGTAATVQVLTVPGLSGYSFQTLTPADLDGATPPAAGTHGIFMRHNDDEAHTGSPVASEDYIDMYEFTPDWGTPANSTLLTLPQVPISEFNSWLIDYSTFASIPQPGTTQRIDPIREAIMQRLAYRNFGGYEVLVGNFVTNENPATTGSTVDAGIRWFEIRSTGGGPWTLYQEGTYGPGDADDNHFMGGIAMDGQGNIGLGFSMTSVDATTPRYPSIGIAGRLASDPLGTLGPEQVVILGTDYEDSIQGRYGDYAAMGIDPSDDCTFWYTNEYMPTNDWATRVTSFLFQECLTDFLLTPTPPTQNICALTDPSAVFSIGVAGNNGWTGAVNLSDNGTNPSGTSSSFNPSSGAVDFSSAYTVSNLMSGTAGDYTINIEGVSGTLTVSTDIYLSFDIAYPAAPILTSPTDAETSVSLYPTFTWSAATDARSYDLEIATDSGFSNIVYQATDLTGTSHTLISPLNSLTPYYWRVGAKNFCDTVYSSTFSFTTVIVMCDTYTSTDIPKSIVDTASSTLTISANDGGTIVDVNLVNLTGTHSWVGDLDIDIESPAATSVRVFDQNCGSDDNFDLNFDDEASSTYPCPPTGGGTYLPDNALSAFDGEDSTGTWTLTLTDNYTSADDGILSTWGLQICAEANADFVLDITPATQEVCQPSDAVYTVDVSGISSSVTLSSSDNPAGTSVDFSPNPVTIPGSSTVTISSTGSASSGVHTFTVEGTDGSGTDSVTADLVLHGGSPGPFSLATPTDTATDVWVAPDLTWNPSSNASAYTVTVATDPGFSNIVYQVGGISGTSHTLLSPLAESSLHYWRVTASNPCGTNTATAFSFTTADVAEVLLVNDSGSTDQLGVYESALTTMGKTYDIWDTGDGDNPPDEPNGTDIAPYQKIIWFTSGNLSGSGPGTTTEDHLATWLDNGGCLLITSQEYHYYKGLTTFMQDYLGASSVTDDTGPASVAGVGSIYGGLGPYTLSYPGFSDYSDTVVPDSTATAAFTDNGNDSAINKFGANYATSFFTFPWETIPSESDRIDTLNAFFDSCAGPPSTDLGVTVNDGSCFVLPGASTTYTVSVVNTGSSDATKASVLDSFPAELTVDSWTCSASAGAVCGSSSGSGSLDDTPNLPAGESVTYTVACTVDGGATGTVTYTVNISAGAGVNDPISANDHDTDRNALEIPVFCDDFESGDFLLWSIQVP